MASSMAATSRLTIRGFESISLSPLRTQIHSISCLPNRFSSYYTSSNNLRYKIGSRNVGPIKIRAMCSDSSGPGPEESVKKTVGENPVVVYSKTWCSYSMEVKSFFKGLGVEPFVVELDQLGSQGAELQKSLETLTGQRTVPNVFIGGEHIGGCTDTIELHQNGELEPLLSKAGATKSES